MMKKNISINWPQIIDVCISCAESQLSYCAYVYMLALVFCHHSISNFVNSCVAKTSWEMGLSFQRIVVTRKSFEGSSLTHRLIHHTYSFWCSFFSALSLSHSLSLTLSINKIIFNMQSKRFDLSSITESKFVNLISMYYFY